MLKKIPPFVFIFVFLFAAGVSASELAQRYIEFGIAAVKAGDNTTALTEFKKVLLIEPDNKTAQTYMNMIFTRELTAERASAAKKDRAVRSAPRPVAAAQVSKLRTSAMDAAMGVNTPIGNPRSLDRGMNRISQGGMNPQALARGGFNKAERDAAMDVILESMEKKGSGQPEPPPPLFPEEYQTLPLEDESKEPGPRIKMGPFAITGSIDLRAGVDSGSNFIWKRANWDLNERNYRNLSFNALDDGFNTYDPRIYNRLALNVDTTYEKGFNVHSNFMFDPWSYIGKSEKVTIMNQAGTDVVQVQLLYWSNTGYTINQTYQSSEDAVFVNVPEMKVVNDSTQGNVSVTTQSGPEGIQTYVLPEIKIYKAFQPARELWLDYVQDDMKIRAFPIAYEDQAINFDDPLKLSNNRIWWEDSPWIRAWKPGTLNRGLTPVDFTKGYYDHSLSAFARDSEGRRLVGLRGVTAKFNPAEGTSIEAGAAAPRNPWQDYSKIDNSLAAMRIKQDVMDNMRLGLSTTGRMGFNINNANKFDTWNYVLGGDISYEILDGLMASGEVAYSQARYDLSESDFKTRGEGYAYYFSLIGRYPFDSIINTQYGYDGIQPEKTEKFFNKFRFFVGRMDKAFDPNLSSYVETRDDEWWGRHLHFRKPFKDYYAGEGELLGWDDVKNFAIGNGMDIGRNVIALRVESSLWDKMAQNLFDIRTVYSNSGDSFIENVAHNELTWRFGSRLTTKFLGLYHVLPKTKAGIDPYIFDPLTRDFVTNTAIEKGKNPSVGVGSLGAEYAFFDWLALNGIWEYTNDISLGLDNYPRRLLNERNLGDVYFEYGNKYREELKFLYSQGFFPKPPYPYINVFKAGLRVNPLENMELYIDYTRNPFEKAGFIDDNMNHIAFEMSYKPMPKWGLFFKYQYSRWQDLNKLIAGDTSLFGHHNFFGEVTFHKSAEEDFTLQYGEGGRNPFMGGFLALNWDPYGGSLATIDTVHVVRAYYRRKF